MRGSRDARVVEVEVLPRESDQLKQVERLERYLDDWIVIPGTNVRVGIDGALGLIPGIGDTISSFISAYILWVAIQLGVPAPAVARMVGNLAIDAAVGMVPLLGDLFDVAWRANRKNVHIMKEQLTRYPSRKPRTNDQVKRLFGLTLFVLVVALIAGASMASWIFVRVLLR